MALDTSLIGSSNVDPVEAADDTEPTSRRPRRRGIPRLKPWWIRAHRWASLTLGLALLVQVVAGAILLMQPEVMRWGYPDRYQSTPAVGPLTAIEALELVQREVPDLQADQVRTFRDVWVVSGDSEVTGRDESAFVDPGTGQINAVAVQSPWIMRALVNLHECGFSCEDYPLYMAWTKEQVPGFSENIEWSGLILGSLGVLLIFMSLSGAVIWWPTIRKFATGFQLRRGRGAYVRDLDLHKLVGIIAIPLLLMWGVSGANFEFKWVEKSYYWLLPGSGPGDPEPIKPGTGPLISIQDAQATALALHPQAAVVGVSLTNPTEPGGTYRFRLREGFDAYKDSYYQGQVNVRVDSHGGGTIDNRKSDGPITQQYWENWQNGLHFGAIVPWAPRLIGVLFGLTPVLLAITGITVWLTRRRSRRNRKAAAKRRAATAVG